MMKKVLPKIVGVLWIILAGCAGTVVQKEIGSFSRDQRAVRFFNHLDMAIEKHGVSDASGFEVTGFPYLRTNRFLAAMKERLNSSISGLFWAEQMLNLDLKSRRKELANLPASALVEISGATGEKVDRDTIYQITESYARRLFRNDRTHPEFIDILKKSITVPDEYSTMARLLGLYPLAGIPVTIATTMAYSRYREWHRTPLNDLGVEGQVVRYFPDEPDPETDRHIFMDGLYDPHHQDAFGLPVLTELEERRLARMFAPVMHQDVTRDYDRIGKVLWRENQVRVDPLHPTAYFYVSFGFLRNQPVLQLNYAFWYSERAGVNTPWMERGPLDGLIYRVTLDRAGKPVMVDIMNSCGCYYFFVPKKEMIAKVVSKPGEIAPLIPAWLPAEYPESRVNLRVNTGWHQVQKVFTGDGSSPGIAYSIVPYEELESLPKSSGQRESVFSPKGIMKDSWRIEPFIFFSMGIRNIGYMRQRGHHAIKMIDRGHFTDPDLFDRSFLFKNTIKKP